MKNFFKIHSSHYTHMYTVLYKLNPQSRRYYTRAMPILMYIRIRLRLQRKISIIFLKIGIFYSNLEVYREKKYFCTVPLIYLRNSKEDIFFYQVYASRYIILTVDKKISHLIMCEFTFNAHVLHHAITWY